ncbi:MAG: MBL fold metallo-hydrolase, partial [Myxococcales bacterium]|nr:MBL fold metallo-hydrolase [Myxococcales bacterium]
PDPQARALLGYLRHVGVRRLDVAVLSHRHPDHYGGLAGLVDHMPIGAVYDHGVPDAGGPWARLAGRLAAAGAPVRRPPAGWTLGDLQVTVLADDPPPHLEENDRSLVLRLAGPGGSVLLTGDVEGPGEARLAGRVPPTSVLKAPHHGSKTSSGAALLAEACPQAVVFTVGRHNRYGFPHPQVQARYAAHGVQAWRTDRDGRVRVRLALGAATIEALRRGAQPLGPGRCGVP